MFCFQCEQTAKGQGCTKIGVCGKTSDVAALQDLLIHTVKGLSQVVVAARKGGIEDAEVAGINQFACEAIFSTLTNVDFDPKRFETLIHKGVALRDQLKSKAKNAGVDVGQLQGPAAFVPGNDLQALIALGEAVGIPSENDVNPDIRSLRELLVYGIKGLAAYTDHARILGQEDPAVYQFIHEAMAATLDENLGVDDLVGLALKCGEVNLTAIQEHEALKERYTFITEQREDLLNSIDSLNKAIRKINKTPMK